MDFGTFEVATIGDNWESDDSLSFIVEPLELTPSHFHSTDGNALGKLILLTFITFFATIIVTAFML